MESRQRSRRTQVSLEVRPSGKADVYKYTMQFQVKARQCIRLDDGELRPDDPSSGN